MTLPTENFPNTFPFSKTKIEVELANDKADTLFKAYLKASLIAKKKKTS